MRAASDPKGSSSGLLARWRAMAPPPTPAPPRPPPPSVLPVEPAAAPPGAESVPVRPPSARAGATPDPVPAAPPPARDPLALLRAIDETLPKAAADPLAAAVRQRLALVREALSAPAEERGKAALGKTLDQIEDILEALFFAGVRSASSEG